MSCRKKTEQNKQTNRKLICRFSIQNIREAQRSYLMFTIIDWLHIFRLKCVVLYRVDKIYWLCWKCPMCMCECVYACVYFVDILEHSLCERIPIRLPIRISFECIQFNFRLIQLNLKQKQKYYYIFLCPVNDNNIRSINMAKKISQQKNV